MTHVVLYVCVSSHRTRKTCKPKIELKRAEFIKMFMCANFRLTLSGRLIWNYYKIYTDQKITIFSIRGSDSSTLWRRKTFCFGANVFEHVFRAAPMSREALPYVSTLKRRYEEKGTSELDGMAAPSQCIPRHTRGSTHIETPTKNPTQTKIECEGAQQHGG